MRLCRHLIAFAAIAICVSTRAEMPGLGEAVTVEFLEVIDFTVMPDGGGLPAGSGTALEGAQVYQQHCLACHGENGTDGINDRLAGGRGSLLTDAPIRTVGSFWPYSTTLFDYIRRAMPYQTPGSLTNDETYAVTAYILSLSDIVGDDMELKATTLPTVKMPNSGNLAWDYEPSAGQ